MSRRKQTTGKCYFCGQEMTRSGMTRHLAACPKRQEAIQAADQKTAKSLKEQPVFHLEVRDAWDGDYWLHLEVNGQTQLRNLDDYLRAIWLECCGHLSMFSVGGWGGEEIPASRRIYQVFEPGVELEHIYDFGTSSHTMVKFVAMRQGKPLTRHPIFLMARNNPPEIACMECGELASWLCIECVYEENKSGFLCDKHAEEHPHEGYGPPLPVVNSPRLGMCGYDGPAEPPY